MLLSTQNVSNVAEVDFTSLISNTYNNYKIVFDNAMSINSSSISYLTVQLSDDNGVTYQNSDYLNYLASGITSGLACGLFFDGLNSYTVSGEMYIHNMLSGISFISHEGIVSYFNATIPYIGGQSHNGVYNGTPLAVNAIRIVSSDSQNISGNFYLYGY